MTRKLQPFRRADGVHELAVLGNFGLSHAYNSIEKVAHFIEDIDADRDSVDPDSYYIQLEDGSLPEYTPKDVHLLRNIDIGDERATYEVFNPANDSDDEDDWTELDCRAADFPNLLVREQLIPMKRTKQ